MAPVLSTPRIPRLFFSLLGIWTGLIAGCASTVTAQKLTEEAHQVKALLVRQADAASLMTAALLASSWSSGPPPLRRTPDPDQWTLAQRATALAPRDPAMAWSKVALCLRLPDCDDVAAAAQFKVIDPTNAAGWLADLQAAAQRSPGAVDAVLTAMGRGKVFSLYFNQRAVEIADAYRRVGVTPGDGHSPGPYGRLTAALGLIAAQPVPGLEVLAHACRDRSEARDRACGAILDLMARGDEILLQSLAASIQMHRLAPGDPNRVAAEAERRTFAWQLQTLTSIQSWPLARSRRAAEQLRLMAQFPTEEDVIRTILREHNRPLEPPPSWLYGLKRH